MIEAFKDMKRGKDSYESIQLERTASQILHHIEDKDGDDSLESVRGRVLANARTIYGPTRALDVITYAPTCSRKIGAALVEHNPTGRSYVHCTSAKEASRLAAMEHLLVITEDLLYHLFDKTGIEMSGWLPTTAVAQQAAATVAGSSVAGSLQGSRRSSVQPGEGTSHAIQQNASDLFQRPGLQRNLSDVQSPSQAAPQVVVPRASSDSIRQPNPVPAGQLVTRHGRVQWNFGSEG